MINRLRNIFGLIFISIIVLQVYPPKNPTTAQDGDTDDACTTLLTEALQVVGSACAEIGQNEACYGHFPVTTELQSDSTSLFESDGDLIAIPQIQTLVTEPANPETGAWGIALLVVEADSQASIATPMTFVLFGDVELSSQEPAASDPPTCSITNDGGQNINLRNTPSTDAEIVGTLAADETATADARNDSADWIRILQADSPAWVYAPLVSTDCDVSALGIPDENGDVISPQTTPAFSLETGQADACNTLPDGLMVRSLEGRRARVVINGVDLVFSSVGFLTAQASQALTLDVLEGQVEVTADGQTEMVSANMSTTIPLSGSSPSGPPSSPQSSDEESGLVIPALNDATVMLDDSGIGNVACAVSTEAAVNLRGGPGTNYALGGQFDSDAEMSVSGTATGTDGAQWWQLDGGSWVRADLVSISGRCDNVELVAAPAPPPTSQAPPASGSGPRVIVQNPSGGDSVWVNQYERGCWPGSGPEPGTYTAAGSLGVVTDGPECGQYYVVFDSLTPQVLAGWVRAENIVFLD